MADAPITYSQISTKGEFDGITSAWADLHDRTGGPFLSHALLSAWLHTLGQRTRFEVRLAWQGPRLVAALPLALGGPPRALVPLAEGRIGLAGALVAPDLDDRAGVLGRLLRVPLGRYLRLEAIEADEAALMVAAARRAGLTATRRRTFIAQSVTFRDDDFDGFIGGLPHTTRRAARRTLRAHADVAGTETLGGDDAVVADYARVARLSWKHRAGTGITATPEGLAFLARLARQARPGSLRIFAGVRGDQPVCCSFAVIDAGRCHLQADEFNEACSGAGHYAILDCLRWSMRNGCRELDFMRSSSVNANLANSQRPLYRVVVGRRGDPTRLLQRIEGARRHLRRAVAGHRTTRAGVLAR